MSSLLSVHLPKYDSARDLEWYVLPNNFLRQMLNAVPLHELRLEQCYLNAPTTDNFMNPAIHPHYVRFDRRRRPFTEIRSITSGRSVLVPSHLLFLIIYSSSENLDKHFQLLFASFWIGHACKVHHKIRLAPTKSHQAQCL